MSIVARQQDNPVDGLHVNKAVVREILGAPKFTSEIALVDVKPGTTQPIVSITEGMTQPEQHDLCPLLPIHTYLHLLYVCSALYCTRSVDGNGVDICRRRVALH